MGCKDNSCQSEKHCCGTTTTETTTKVTQSGVMCDIPSGTTMYVGARIIPEFAEPVEWSGDRPYEHLTFVSYRGDTYISKIPVPPNTDISDTNYWYLASNWSAQVEQYREELVEYKEETDEKIGSMKTLAFVGNYGAIEKDSTVDWQSVINSVAEKSDIIDFGAGTWYTDQTIVIPKSIKKVVGSCTILATGRMERLIEIERREHTDYRPFVFDGITLESSIVDGVPCVDTLFWTDSNNINITSCHFRNFKSYGAFCPRLGLRVSDCQFMNQDYKCHGIGVHNRTDMFVTDCRFFYCELGVSIRQGWVTGCYFFSQTGPNYGNIPISAVGFLTEPDARDTRAINVVVENCEFDCMNRIFRNINNATIRNNWCWWNGNDDGYIGRHSIFYNDDFASNWALQNVEFSDNTIGIDKSLPLTELQPIYMFDNIATLENYISENCVLYNLLDSDGQSDIVKLAVGMRNNMLNAQRSYETTDSQSYVVTRIVPQRSYSGSNQILLDMPTYNANFRKFGVRTGGAFIGRKMPLDNTVIKIVHAKNGEANSDMYITVPASAIKTLILNGAPQYIDNLKPISGNNLEDMIADYEDYQYTYSVPATN